MTPTWSTTSIIRPKTTDIYGRPLITREEQDFIRRVKNRGPVKLVRLHGVERHETQEKLTERECI